MLISLISIEDENESLNPVCSVKVPLVGRHVAGGGWVLQRAGRGLQGGVQLQAALQGVWRGGWYIYRMCRYLDICPGAGPLLDI